jgi:DNA-directed RNA polymerase subunit E'/Rpb7
MWGNMSASALLICINVFGVPVEYGRGSALVQIKGIFDANYVEVDPDTGAYVMSAGPMLCVRASDLPEGKALKGDLVTVKEVNYRVLEPKPDSEGGIKVILQRVAR